MRDPRSRYNRPLLIDRQETLSQGLVYGMFPRQGFGSVDITGVTMPEFVNPDYITDYQFGFVPTFDGTNYIDSGVEEVGVGVDLFADGTQAFSVAAWFRIPTATDATIWAKGQTNSNLRTLQMFFLPSTDPDYSPGFNCRGDWMTTTTAWGLNDNDWHLVVLIHDDQDTTNLTAYYDDAQGGFSVPIGTASRETGQRIIHGARTNGTGFLMQDGELGPMFIYNRKISTQEVRRLHAPATRFSMLRQPAVRRVFPIAAIVSAGNPWYAYAQQ